MSQTSTPFPAEALGMAVSVTSTASAQQALVGAGNQILIFNEGPNNAWYAIGATGIVATLPTSTPAATCMQIPANSVQTYTRNSNTSVFISAICRAAGTATLSVYVGDGS